MGWCLRCGQKKKWFRKHVCLEQLLQVQKHGGPKKISELPRMYDPSGEDLLVVSDTSESTSKHITMAQLKSFIRS